MKNALLFILVLFSHMVFSQVTITGILQTTDGKPLVKANVLLIDKANNIDTYTFSNNEGKFSLQTENYGDFVVEINAMNYISKREKVSFMRRGTIIDLKNLVVEKMKTEDIKEVIITRANPIKLKKDTVEYVAEKFSNGTEKNVEELLKKLPGVTVQQDGKIKVGDKEVESVMVEGDDLFERGYQTLTQNMPTKPVEKIQVLKNYSKNKLLKNVEKSESVAINLTLKEKEKGKWFNSLALASTSYIENRHQAKINLMNFSKKKKIYLLYNANNLGLNEMNGVQYLINPNSDKDVENVGADVSTISLLNLHQKNYSFGDNRTNFNNDQLASLNYIYNFEKNWKLKFVTIYNTIENRNYTDSYYRFSFGGTSFTNVENKSWKQNNTNVVGKLELTKDFKKDANLVLYSKFSSLKEDNDNAFIFNQNPNLQIGNNQLLASENRLVYTKKIDSSQAVVAVARYIRQNRPYYFSENTDIAAAISGNPLAKTINQNVNSSLDFAGLKFSWLKNYSKDQNLQIQTGADFRKQALHSDLSVLDVNNQTVMMDSNLYLNDILFFRKMVFNKIDYKTKWNKRWLFSANIQNEYWWTELNGNKKDTYSFSPALNLGYDNYKTGNINLNFSRKFANTAIDNLYAGYIYQGNRSFRKNDLEFTQMPNYSVGLSYNKGDQLTRMLSVSVNYTKNEDYISNQSIIQQNYSFNQSILVKNNELWMANIELKRYLKYIKSRVSILGSFMQSDYQSSINNQPLLTSQFTNYKIGLEMKSGFLGKFNYEWGYTWKFNFVKSDINKNNFTDQDGFVNLYFNFNKFWKANTKLEFYKPGNSQQSNTTFLDVKLDYLAQKINTSFFVAANNLFNNKEIRRYSIDNISESAYTQRLLPLHIVLGLSKNF